MTECVNPRLVLRLARESDQDLAARIIHEVSDGVTQTLLGGLLPGKRPEEILSLAFARRIDPYRIENVVMLEVDNKPAGMFFAYESVCEPVSPVLEAFVPKRRVDAVRELLTAGVPGSLWIHTLWVDEAYRGQGAAQLILNCAQKKAQALGLKALALHVFNDNARACAFYRKSGFEKLREISYRGDFSALHPLGGSLLVKPLSLQFKEGGQ